MEIPKPLPDVMLEQRKAVELPWERFWEDGELDEDERIDYALRWAEQKLTSVIVSQRLGADSDDDDFMDRVDEMHNALRNGFTRHELIRLVLHAIRDRASANADNTMIEFFHDLENLTGA